MGPKRSEGIATADVFERKHKSLKQAKSKMRYKFEVVVHTQRANIKQKVHNISKVLSPEGTSLLHFNRLQNGKYLMQAIQSAFKTLFSYSLERC